MASKRATPESCAAPLHGGGSIERRLPALLVALDATAQLTEATDDWLFAFGCRRDAMIGRTLVELMTPAAAARLRNDIWPTVLLESDLRDVELQFVRPSGEIVEMLATFRVVRDDEDRFRHVLASFVDATARNRSDEQHRLTFEAGGIGAWCSDMSSGQLTFSGRGRALFGLSGDDGPADYESFLRTVHPEDRPLFDFALRRSIAEHGDIDVEVRCIQPDGTVRWLQTRGRSYWDDAGRLLRLQGIAFDVTARKNAEEQLRQAQKMEAVGHLTGGIAHDFNNFLTVIVGNLDRLATACAGRPDATRFVEQAQAAVDRAERLTAQLLSFSRRQKLSPEPLHAGELVGGIADLLKQVLHPAVALDVDIPGGLWRMAGDRNQIETALLNLVINARDAMPGAGRLTIAARNATVSDAESAAAPLDLAPGDYVRLAVSDTGTGMPAHVRARVFEPFFTTKERGKGTGLGLAQVYGFARQSGGTVHVDSEEGIGTTVALYLPRSGGTGADGNSS